MRLWTWTQGISGKTLRQKVDTTQILFAWFHSHLLGCIKPTIMSPHSFSSSLDNTRFLHCVLLVELIPPSLIAWGVIRYSPHELAFYITNDVRNPFGACQFRPWHISSSKFTVDPPIFQPIRLDLSLWLILYGCNSFDLPYMRPA